MSGEFMGAALGLAGGDDEMAAYNEQLAQANALRDTAMPEMRGAGRVNVAANPLEFLSSAMKQRKGHKEREDVLGKQDTARKDRKTNLGRLQRAIAKAYGGGMEEEEDVFAPPSNARWCMPFNQYLTGATPAANAIPPELQEQIANSLRTRDGMGAIMALTGDRAAGPVGQQLMKDTNAQRQQLINQRYYQGLLEQGTAGLAERRRATDLQHQANMARTAAIAGKQKSSRPMPRNLAADLSAGGSLLRSTAKLQEGFNPDWHSSIPGVNALRNTVARMAPDISTEAMQDAQMWRQQFVAELEAVQRHKLYGAALTATEVQYWKEQALNPGANMRQLHKFFNTMRDKLTSDLEAKAAGASYDYPMEQIEAYIGGRGPAPEVEEALPPDANDDLAYEVIPDANP
jgi:hypothetical protein